MNNRNLFGIAFLVIATAFDIQTLQHSPVEAQQSVTQAAPAIEFARLEIESEDSVTWLIGGVVRGRT